MSRWFKLGQQHPRWPARHALTCERRYAGLDGQPDDRAVCTCGVTALRAQILEQIKAADRAAPDQRKKEE